MSTKTYAYTYLAGPWVAGRRRGTETTIELTDDEAEYDLRNGTIVLAGGQTTPPAPLPVVLPTDLLGFLRNGIPKGGQVSDLVLFLLGTSQSAGPIRAAIVDMLAGIDVASVSGLGTALASKASQADLTALRTSLLNGADAAHDTFGELQSLLLANDGLLASLLTAVGNRLIAASNLSDLKDKAAARGNLGLTTLAATGRLTDASLTGLPTELPAQPGVLWNNGGLLSIS